MRQGDMNPDPLFRALIGATFTGLMSARITVQIDGMLIMGKLISEKAYFAAVQDLFAQEGTYGTALTANLFQSFAEHGVSGEFDKGQLMDVPMFFMEDATVYANDKPGLWLGWWRGRVDAVTGWTWTAPQLIEMTEEGDEAGE